MINKFDTDSLAHAKAALLLYAMYRSRSTDSSLNGLETWSRCNNYIRGAILKSTNIAEFVQHFCKKAGVGSIKPHLLETDGLIEIDEHGTLANIEGFYNFQLDIFEDKEVLALFENEAQYIILLVREGIQREKELFNNDN